MLTTIVYGQSVASNMPRRYSLFPFRFWAGGRRMQHLLLRMGVWRSNIRAKGNKPRSVWLASRQLYWVVNLPPPCEPLVGRSLARA